MSEHKVDIVWNRESSDFALKNYNRSHAWDFGHGVEVQASAAAAYLGNEECPDPEQAFTASLASCHMLTFLAVASQKGYVINSYRDKAVGVLAKGEDGKMAMVEVKLSPEIDFGSEHKPTEEQLNQLHDLAHQHCFIANSVTTKVSVL